MALNVPPQIIQSIMQQLMGNGGAGAKAMPQMPNVPGPVTPDMVMQQMMQQPGQHFDPEETPEGEQSQGKPTDEEELESVRQDMTQRDPTDVGNELMQCLDDHDRQGCEEILAEMEETGMPISALPPNVQQELDRQGYMDDEQGEAPDSDDNQQDEYE